MDQIMSQLRSWGCDVDSAMARMLDDEEFYIECLNTIPEERGFTELAQALEKRDAAAAFDSAHTLKGLLANLGLTPMYNVIVQIVEPLRVGNCDGLTEKLDELALMRKHLGQILQL